MYDEGGDKCGQEDKRGEGGEKSKETHSKSVCRGRTKSASISTGGYRLLKRTHYGVASCDRSFHKAISFVESDIVESKGRNGNSNRAVDGGRKFQ